MTLRHRFTCLLIIFAAFAVLSAGATIYGINLQVSDVIRDFERSVNETDQVHHLRRLLREQVLQLYEIVEGRRTVTTAYTAERDQFFSKLRSVGRLARDIGDRSASDDVHALARSLRRAFDRCLALTRAGQAAQALTLLTDQVEGELLRRIISRLRSIERRLGDTRSHAVTSLVGTATRVLFLTIVVAALGAVLVVVGAALIRRWLFIPIAQLQTATAEFSNGHFQHRTHLARDDELGRLGTALNTMAQSVSDAQAKLTASETKHRSLFENLRDAVVIIDAGGRVIECHDSDSKLLGVDGADPTGRHILQAWPAWQHLTADWTSLLEDVIRGGQRYRKVDVELGDSEDRQVGLAPGRNAVVDLIVYRIEYDADKSPTSGTAPCPAPHAVVVLRDVSERHRLQTRLRQAETAEAIGTLAGGIAHDFNNLLTSAIGTLSVMQQQIGDGPQAGRIHTALRACWQAAGLARRLLNFASSAHGYPQIFSLPEAVQLILDSFDESFFTKVHLQTDLDCPVQIKIDRDQLTQLVLNLVRNACDAMPDGGTLRIAVQPTTACDPEHPDAPLAWALLTVADTGVGMTPAARTHVFEPFFTTKRRGARRGRGMGMATVYAAVKGAGGFIQFDTEPNVGTTFRIYLPQAIGAAADTSPTSGTGPWSAAETPLTTFAQLKGGGNILVVDDDPMVLPVCKDLLEQWGYSVVDADSVATAREKFVADVDNIPLAIIDIHLADADQSDSSAGVDLATELVELSPDLRIVFITGHAEKPIPSRLLRNVCARLPKPFRMDTLAASLASVLPPITPQERRLEMD